MGNGNLEVYAQLQSCDLTGIPESRWGCSHDWSATVDGYRLSGNIVRKRGCAPCKIGAGQNSGKGRGRPANVAALYFQELKQNIITGLVNKLTL